VADYESTSSEDIDSNGCGIKTKQTKKHCTDFEVSKILKNKYRDWRCGSSNKLLTLQVQDLSSNPAPPKRKKDTISELLSSSR
jgi:hypothetical protein